MFKEMLWLATPILGIGRHPQRPVDAVLGACRRPGSPWVRSLLRTTRESRPSQHGHLARAHEVSRPVLIRRLRALEAAGLVRVGGRSAKGPPTYWRLPFHDTDGISSSKGRLTSGDCRTRNSTRRGLTASPFERQVCPWAQGNAMAFRAPALTRSQMCPYPPARALQSVVPSACQYEWHEGVNNG